MTETRRIALVTGGARGIGASISEALAADGLIVAVADIDSDAARQTASALPRDGHDGFYADVTDEASVVSLFDAVSAKLGRPSVLVTCAGILLFKEDGSRPLVVETDFDHWNRTMAVNAAGCFLCTREYARRAPDRDELGRIVTISSVAAQLGGYRSSASYIASKAAVLGLTKALARELADRGITANSVAPGLIDAPMLRLSLDPSNDAAASATIPLGRLGRPDDVASAVSFLVSPQAGYVTGTTIDVNGGYRMQ
ncbi:SDR family NAD(P)-dependent oxidoreductase [Microvirga splendida]|uniref:SDR family oxidoreductase n=1 Tax=Microvirga splendida TaxID=2795727 RepID=A0ABS0Y763_9HYPH|nr:SDR family oxidoreductase [Microvirga splendida]MBJ6128131.1 SDR family oxidoreductase [Microvirga splendida]